MAETNNTSPRPSDQGHWGESWQSLLVLAGSSSHWWRPLLELRFRTASAAGLQAGMQVKVAGIPVGRVSRLRIGPDAQVLVSLDVDEEHRRLLGLRSRASLAQDNLLGQSYIAISPDPQALGGKTLPEDALIAYDDQPNLEALLRSVAETRIPLQKALGASVGLARQRIPASLDELDQTLRASRQLAKSLEQDLGSTTRTVNGTALQLRRTTSEANQLLRQAGGSSEQALPLLLQTLQELQGIATTTHALVRRLDRSLLLELLSPPASTPLAAPQQGSVSGATAAPGVQERNRRE
jgi:phospholipid/cholesterol/gamma-HCH transport system substrate-binding protein